jgi:hypothetical protein
MKRFPFEGSHTVRKFVVDPPKDGERYYGIGIATPAPPSAGLAYVGGSGPRFPSTGAHGLFLANGVPVGPRAPLPLDGVTQGIAVELIGYMTGPLVVQVATCRSELELLRAPRGPHVARHALDSAGLPDFYEIAVPFQGRARFRGKVYLGAGGVATGLTVRTIARFYHSDGTVEEEELNEYSSSDVPGADAAKSYHETERCDEIAMQVEHSSGAEPFRFEAAAYDEGT